MAIDDQMERRQFGRRQTHLRGKIKLPGRGTRFCSVRNISHGGALLVFERAECMPFGFLLTIEGEQTVYGCEVRHHFGERVGVAFVDVSLIVPSDPDSWLAPHSTQHRH
jgi:PilZ domain